MNDDEMQKIKRILDDKDSNTIHYIKQNFTLKRGVVYKITDEGLRWYVPKGVRWQVLHRSFFL